MMNIVFKVVILMQILYSHRKVWIVRKCAYGLQNLHNKAKELIPLT